MPRSAVVYCRKSKEDRNRESASLDNQEATCREFAARMGWPVTSAHLDNGVPGDTPLDRRDGLRAAVSALAPGDVLLVLRRERLFRADDFTRGQILRAVELAGAEVWSTQGEGSGDATASGVIFRGILDVISFAELRRIRERTGEVVGRLRGDGRRVGQLAYGRKSAADGAHVEPSPEDRDAAAIARRLRNQGHALRGIGEVLASLGIAPKNAGRIELKRLRELQRLLAEGRTPDAAADAAGVPPEAVPHLVRLTRDGLSLKAVAAVLPSLLPTPAVEPWSVTSIRRLLGELPCKSKPKPTTSASNSAPPSPPTAAPPTPSPTPPEFPGSPSAAS